MNYDYKILAQGPAWDVQWKRIRGEESVSLNIERGVQVTESLLSAARQHKAWHLFSANRWDGGSLSVFEPLQGQITRLSLSAEKTTKIEGLEGFRHLNILEIGGDLSAIDFSKMLSLKSLVLIFLSKGGNWHECASLEHLLIDVPTTNLKKLKALKNLRSLSVGRGLKSLEGATNLPALRELRIGACHLASLESMGKLPNLRLLLLNLMPKLTSLRGLDGAPNLEELDVTQCGGLNDVTAIEKLSKLRKLTLHFCPLIKSLDGVMIAPDCKVSFGGGGKVREGF